MPSVTSCASTIVPAHVASVARPPRIASRSGSSRPTRSMSIVMVVLSPPGRTIPSRPSRSTRVRTSRVRAPAASRARTCSAKAPCIARTPIKGKRAPCARPAGKRAPCARPAGKSAPCARPACARVLLERAELPASGSEQLVLWDGRDLETVHRLAEPGGHFGQDLRLVEIGRRRDDRLGTLQGVLRLEDARPDEHPIDTELHHQRGVGGGRDTTGREVDHRQATELLTLDEHLDRSADLLGLMHELCVVHSQKPADTRVDSPCVANRLDDVAYACLALGPDHRGAFRKTPRRFTHVAAAPNERDLERVLVDMVFLVGGSEHL